MNTTLARARASEIETDCLILFEAKGARRADLLPALVSRYDSGEITGKQFQFTLLHGVSGFKARRILIAGVGKKEKCDATVLRKVTGAAIRFLKGRGAVNTALALDATEAISENVAAVVEGAVLGAWEPDYLKTDPELKELKARSVASLAIVVAPEAADAKAVYDRARIVADAINLARDISVEPPNLLDPLRMAEHARQVAAAEGLTIDVLDRDRMTQLGMGALLGVAQGSAAPPALIVLEYKPEKPTSSDRLAFVGKGVTFDTGGISIKPSDGMEKMKYDMAGGASVIAAMQAIARLKPPVSVIGIVPAVENMPGGRAQRPGDIVKSLSGKTVEVLNTDAEGRLILIDAITYAKSLGCTHIVDTATLTGAIVVALGHSFSGVFANNDALRERWMAAASSAGERMWHMPLDEDFEDLLKTDAADIQNIGGRWGGACSAAAFIEEFVDDTPWIHIDIAGTGWLDDAKPFMAKGPTGVPVGAFVNLAMDWK
jgi:leucyl aminopeptidase